MTDQNPASPLGRNRGIRALLELARAIIADGRVTSTDIQLFENWLLANPDLSGTPPVPDLVRRFRAVGESGAAGERARAELAQTLKDVVGEPVDGHSQGGSVSRPYLIFDPDE
jgi:hypothetical protein